MSRDLDAIARVLGARLELGGALTRSSRVSEAMPLDEHVVAGHTFHVTLLVADARQTNDALESARIEPARFENVALVCVGGTIDSSDADPANPPPVTLLRIDDGDPREVLLRLRTLLAVDAAADDRATLSATKVLTLAARRSGAVGVVVELARRIDGWAVLLDRDGDVIAKSGAGGLHVQDAVATAFHRPVRVRATGLQVHPVGEATDVSAYIVVSSRRGTTTRTRDLGSQAAALLDLVLRTHDGGRTERLGRATMMRVLREGGARAVELLRDWGVRERTLVAVALSARRGQLDAEALLIEVLRELGATPLVSARGPVVLAYLRADDVDPVLAACAARPGMLHVGVGTRARVDALASSADQALLAHETAADQGRESVRYETLPTVGLVLDRLSTADATRIAALLDPLDAELVETLRVWLAENGSWTVSASRLGIHRQTLSSRIQRIEDATGLTMDSPDDRAAAWLSIRARGAIAPTP